MHSVLQKSSWLKSGILAMRMRSDRVVCLAAMQECVVRSMVLCAAI